MMISDAVFAVMDLETTGFDPETEAPVEVAVTSLQVGAPEECQIIALGSDLIDPGRPIPPEARAVHHLSDADVRGKIDLDTALKQWPMLNVRGMRDDQYVPVAHNARFDAAFWTGVDPQEDGWLCTYRLASHLWPNAPGHGNQVLRYWLDLDAEMVFALTMPPHRALPDTYVTAHLLRAILEAAPDSIDTVEALHALGWAPIEQSTCRFGKHRGTPWAEVPMDYLRWMRRQGADQWDADVWHTVALQWERRKS